LYVDLTTAPEPESVVYATYVPPTGARSPVGEYFPTQYPVRPTWLVAEYPAGTNAEFANVAPLL
jgi:hypothetical protein